MGYGRKRVHAVAAVVVVVLTIAGCGGGGRGGHKATGPSAAEKDRISTAFGDILAFCISQISGSGDEVKAGDDLDLLIRDFHRWPDRALGSPFKPGQTMRKLLSSVSTQLGKPECDPQLGSRADSALASG